MWPVEPTTAAPVLGAPREAILLAAIDSAVVSGFGGLASAHVAAEAGVDPATVRQQYPTQVALAEAILDHITLCVLQTLNDDLPPADRLRLHLASLGRTIQERPALFAVLLELELRGLRDGLVRAALARSKRAWRAALARLFDDGIREGAFAADIDVDAVVELVIAAAVGASVWRNSPGSLPLGLFETLVLGS